MLTYWFCYSLKAKKQEEEYEDEEEYSEEYSEDERDVSPFS